MQLKEKEKLLEESATNIHPAKVLFNDISAMVEERGGWGHGYKSVGRYQDYILIYTAGFKDYAGKVETLMVRRRVSFFRREKLLHLESEQPAMNSPKAIRYDAKPGCGAELEKLITALKEGQIGR